MQKTEEWRDETSQDLLLLENEFVVELAESNLQVRVARLAAFVIVKAVHFVDEQVLVHARLHTKIILQL